MKRIQSLLVVAALAFATAGNAATITVTWDTPVVNPPSADTVGITMTAPAYSNGSVATGRFRGTLSNANPAGIAGAFPNYPTIYAYCYDLFETLNSGQVISYGVNTGADADVLNFLGAANAYLGGGVLDWLNPTAVGSFSAAEIASAIQLGIWEGLYEAGGAFALGAGNIQFSGVDGDVAGAYAAIVALLGSPDLAAANAIVLTNRGKQDVITGSVEQFDVPEPGALVLLGFAAVAAGVARRRTH
jgi:hypothetical protein